MKNLKRKGGVFLDWLFQSFATLIVPLFYGNIWNLKDKTNNGGWFYKQKKRLYFAYLREYGSWIGLGAIIKSPPITPHDIQGIFISTNAEIGNRVVIMHQVTIGSNTSHGSAMNGSPTIEDDVFIGAGAKIIGNVRVGHHARIGANCVVVKDVPPNSVTVIRNIQSIIKEEPLDNHWISANSEKCIK